MRQCARGFQIRGAAVWFKIERFENAFNIEEDKAMVKKEQLYEGKATRADITRVTKRLGDEIAAIYGFHISKQRISKEQGR